MLLKLSLLTKSELPCRFCFCRRTILSALLPSFKTAFFIARFRFTCTAFSNALPPDNDTVVEKKTSRTRKAFGLLLKLSVTALCFWYISKKIDLAEAARTFQKANRVYLVAGLLLYFFSKVIASVRLNVYFKNIRIQLPQAVNFRLYLLGLFYNLFLPGSIGGDAYKVLLLKKRLNAPYRKTSLAVFIDRFSGLLGLGVTLCFFGALVLSHKWMAAALPLGLFVAIIASYFSIKQWAADFLPGFWPTFLWGLAVQVFSSASAFAVIFSLGIYTNLNEYMFIFSVASIAAMLPLTLGGLGAREVVFYQLSAYFGLDAHSSVLIGLLFYFMSVVTSATGSLYVFIDPLKSTGKDQWS